MAEQQRQVIRMTYEHTIVYADGRERVIQQCSESFGEDQISDFLEDSIGPLVGLIVNSICNGDEPTPQSVMAQALRRARDMEQPFRELAQLYDEWAGEESFVDFVNQHRTHEVSKAVEQSEGE